MAPAQIDPAVVSSVKDILLAILAVVATIRSVPLFQKISRIVKSRAKLISEHADALDIAEKATRAANSQKEAAEGWESAFRSLASRVDEMSADITRLKRRERNTERLLRVAVHYIRDLVKALEAHGAIAPLPPAELAEAIARIDLT